MAAMVDNNAFDLEQLSLDEHTIKGSIISVEVKHFKIFDDFKYNFRPGFNLIIGSDDIKKSAILMAFALAFESTAEEYNSTLDCFTFISQMKEYVKEGQPVATVDVEICLGYLKSVILGRSINATDGSSIFYIDNLPVTRLKYTELIESLNIELENYGQFILENRMDGFTKLNSNTLLVNTLHSVERGTVWKTFLKLLEITDCIGKYKHYMSKLKEQIISESSANLRLRRKINSFSNKEVLECELLSIIQQKSWIMYTMILKKINYESEKFEIAKTFNRGALGLIQQEKKIVKKKINEMLKSFVDKHLNVEGVFWSKLSDEVNNIKPTIQEMRNLYSHYENHLKTLKLKEEYLLLKEETLEKMKNGSFGPQECSDELIELISALKEINNYIDPMKIKLEEIKTKIKQQDEIINDINKEIDNENGKEKHKNYTLQKHYPIIWKAISWLRSCDKKMFQGQVFEPLFTQIEVIDLKNTIYIEEIINYKDMVAFVFEYESDLLIFNEIVKKEGWNGIRSVYVPPYTCEIDDLPKYDINCLKRYGFHSYALDLIRTPPIIKRYLIKVYEMHNIPIGSKKVIPNIIKEPKNIPIFFADDIRVKTSVSVDGILSYSDQLKLTIHLDFFKFYVNPEVIQYWFTKLDETKAVRQVLEKKENDIITWLNLSEESHQFLLKKRKDIAFIFLLFENGLGTVNAFERAIELKKKEIIEDKKKNSALMEVFWRIKHKYMNSMMRIIDLLDIYVLQMKYSISSVFVFTHRIYESEEKEIWDKLKLIYKSNTKHIDHYLKYLGHLETQLIQKEERALYWSQGTSLYDKYYQQLEEDINQIDYFDMPLLDSTIDAKKAELNSSEIDSKAPLLMKKYNERKREIRDMEDKYHDANYYVQFKAKEMKIFHKEWFPNLKEFCSMLNLNFQKLLAVLGSNGRVELEIDGSSDDYKSYGLSICVKFSNTVSFLMQLDKEKPSYNERALIQTLFWFSFQDIANYPFRVIANIKQGVSGQFERKLTEFFMKFFESRVEQNLFFISPEMFEKLVYKTTKAHIIFCIPKHND